MRSMQILLMWAAALIMLFHNLPISEADHFEDHKNFFFPAVPTPPTVSYTPPAVSFTPPPRHGGGSSPPAVSYTPPPSHGGGSAPPAHCTSPPNGGGNHHPTPSPPTGGGYRRSPPTITPIITTPPSPPSPLPFDPNSPPFTCTYWRNHPRLVWGLFGWWGTVGSAFGVSATPAGVGAQTSLLEALSNTRTDGYGELYREGTAALLNSMAHTSNFPYKTTHVRDSFVAALRSNKVASAQAHLFKLANDPTI